MHSRQHRAQPTRRRLAEWLRPKLRRHSRRCSLQPAMCRRHPARCQHLNRPPLLRRLQPLRRRRISRLRPRHRNRRRLPPRVPASRSGSGRAGWSGSAASHWPSAASSWCVTPSRPACSARKCACCSAACSRSLCSPSANSRAARSRCPPLPHCRSPISRRSSPQPAQPWLSRPSTPPTPCMTS